MSDITNESIQESVDEAECLAEAKLRAQAIIDKEIEEEQKNTPWYKKLFAWGAKLFLTVVKVVFNCVKPTVVYIINCERNQTLAKLAVLTAIEAGLKGECAFKAAMKVLSEGKLWISDTESVDPSSIDTNIKETLIQLIYTCIKNRVAVA